nr:unnamed protein product [Callosobruchus analis]
MTLSGYVLHYYYNQCVDDNECQKNPCGSDGHCFNTPGSYRCGCPDGYQYDGNLNICIQVAAGCTGAPCAFGCTSSGASYSCGCPQGYQRIGQGHCLSTVTPAYASYSQDIGDVPINGRHRRAPRHRRLGHSTANDTVNHLFKRYGSKRRIRRHHHGEEVDLKINISQTRHRTRILKLQPSVKKCSTR